MADASARNFQCGPGDERNLPIWDNHASRQMIEVAAGTLDCSTVGRRMMVIIVRHPRPKPERIETATDQERADLLRTMTAYAGTYKFDGAKIEHRIDVSMNETWTGTTQVRSVKRDGERLVYKTPPFNFHTDGKMSINTLIWEKVK